MDAKSVLVLSLAALLWAGIALVWQRGQINFRAAELVVAERDLAAARAESARWQATAQARAAAADAQAGLAGACLAREAQAATDAAEIADILATVRPQPLTPDQARQGVDHATRQRAADMLNRPW